MTASAEELIIFEVFPNQMLQRGVYQLTMGNRK